MQEAIKEAVVFIAMMAGLFVLPGMAMLYSDWKNKKGWFE